MKHKSDIIIGLEVHVELNTKTKLFCSCPTKGSEEPNTRTCEICLGMPGSKPVLNKKAIEFALKLCLALNCNVSKELIFSRKSYFYPDLAKNYQITQYEMPLGKDGKLMLSDGKAVGITRIHLEEDPASLVHPSGLKDSSYVLIDYNRSGNPLVEIVTNPEMYSADEARDFMKQLLSILEYLEVFDINHCIIKADANISIKESDYTKVEVKNITGFKEIESALSYEIERQKLGVTKSRIVQETRGWDSVAKITYPLRAKESAEDYGYIIDTDLVPIEITKQLLSEVNATLPEFAQDKARRFVQEYKIAKDDAEIISSDKSIAELFEKCTKRIYPILSSKWVRRELIRVLNYHKKSLREINLEPNNFIDLLELIQNKEITEKIGQRLIERLAEGQFDVKEYVKKHGLSMISEEVELEKFCESSIKENQKAIEDYKNGNEKALNFVIGAVMKKSKGKAKPDTVKDIILRLVGK
ncbi:MAG: Asp-tRNA(Asn)/Glu-tRNA(Gln) amidotransferase subunit GatB [Nanoarchaeota archaeon]